MTMGNHQHMPHETERDLRHRARVLRALAARPDIPVSTPEFCELLESSNPEALIDRIARDRQRDQAAALDVFTAGNTGKQEDDRP
jgi:hypothetical protein